MYPEWQKNIRQAQAERDEREQKKKDDARWAKEKYEAEQRKIANEQFAFVLEKLIGLSIALTADGECKIGDYLFRLGGIRQYSIRYDERLFIDCQLGIARGETCLLFEIHQQARDGDWLSYQSSLADMIDTLDKAIEQQDSLKKSAEATLTTYEYEADAR